MEIMLGIIGFLMVTLLGIIGYFLRALHNDVKDNISQTAENKANIDLLKVKSDGKIDKLAERTEMQIGNLVTAIKDLKSIMEHANNGNKTRDKVLLALVNKSDLDLGDLD